MKKNRFRNIDERNIIKLFLFDFKNHRRVILGWCLAMVAIMFLYMGLYPSMKEMAQMEMEAMPEALLQFMGMDAMTDLNNYINYFGMMFSMVLIAISIFAVTFSGGLIYKEEKTKSIEFLSSLGVSRGEIYLSKVLVSIFGVFLVLLCTVLPAFFCGIFLGGESFNVKDFMFIVRGGIFSVYFFAAFSFFVAGATARISSGGISSMVILLSYLMGYLGVLLKGKADWLKFISPLELFSPTNMLAVEAKTFVALGIYWVLTMGCWIGGYFLYSRRDLRI